MRDYDAVHHRRCRHGQIAYGLYGVIIGLDLQRDYLQHLINTIAKSIESALGSLRVTTES